MMNFLQKLGKSMMLPVAVLPICGILMGIGYLICPAGIQGGEISGVLQTVGFLLIKTGGAIIDHMAWLFVIGVALGMSDDQNGSVCMAALVSWLIVIFILSPKVVSVLFKGFLSMTIATDAFAKIDNPFVAIICGVLAAECYNRFRNTKLPDYLAFFSGRRFVVIITALLTLALVIILAVVWPILFNGLTAFGKAMVKMGGIGAGIYAFLNRLLMPFGLHHALNNVFWFDTIGIGDLTNFWAGKTSADVGWSLGMYMSGFFPCMMFGVPGIAAAMIKNARDKIKAKSCVTAPVICMFLSGVGEPFEFMFFYSAFPLYFAYALLYGIFTVITYYTGFRAGFSFSAGLTDFIFSLPLPAAQNVWLIIPLGLGAFAAFYFVGDIMIRKLNLNTPGREAGDEENAVMASGNNSTTGTDASLRDKSEIAPGKIKEKDQAISLIKAIGGRENIEDVDCCVTRLRLTLKDSSLVDANACKAAGAFGVVLLDKKSCQVIIGMTVQQVCDAIRQELSHPTVSADCDTGAGSEDNRSEDDRSEDNSSEDSGSENDGSERNDHSSGPVSCTDVPSIEQEQLAAPADGELIPQENIPDEVFASGVLGRCIGIDPVDGKIYSPCDGEITMVADTKHAIGITSAAGKEILIHAGIDTVKLKGEGFKCEVIPGQKIKKGDLILMEDVGLIREKGYSPIVIMVY